MKPRQIPFSSDDDIEGVDLYNEDYDDDEPIEAGRKGSSIYIQHNKVRLYTPSNTSSIGPQERYKSKSNLISDNEEVLTMSDIDVSNDG